MERRLNKRYLEMDCEVVAQAGELLSDPARWTTRVFARGAAGDACDPRSDLAVCWCAIGAVQKFAKTRASADRVADHLNRVSRGISGYVGLADTNDYGGYVVVQKVFAVGAKDYARELAAKREKTA